MWNDTKPQPDGDVHTQVRDGGAQRERRNIYSTFAFDRPEGTLGPRGGSFGCGLTTAYDFDLSHPISTRYRLRVTYRDPSASGRLEGTAGITSIHQLPPRVVINEFRTRGPNGTADQFVELFNDSLTASNASLNLCASSNDVLAPNCVGLPATTIGPFCHYLIAGPRYSGSVRGDFSVPAMLYDDGYLTIIPTFAAFTQSVQSA